MSTQQKFTYFENKVDEVMSILNSMSLENQTIAESNVDAVNQLLGTENFDNDSFLAKVKNDRTFINKIDPPSSEGISKNKFVFMNDIEKDINRRSSERKQREATAQELRKIGNQAFRNWENEKAVNIYSKAIDQVRDSPILYNNRALSYIRLSLYKRAIIDCDYVLNKLDEKNIRSWLYRAKAYYLLQDQCNYEKCIVEARKHHPKEINYIIKIISEIEGENKHECVEFTVEDGEGDKILQHGETFIELTK